MGFGIGEAIGAGLGMVTSVVGGQMTNDANAEQAQANRNWQEYMSATAHQREVTDLRRAGLNPILSATGGRGAPVGSGGQATMQNILAPGVTSAMDAIRLKNDLNVTNTKLGLEAQSTESQVGLNKAIGNANAAAAMKDIATAKQSETANQALQLQMQAIGAEAKTRQGQAEWDKKMQEYDNVTRRLKEGLETGGAGANLIQKFLPGVPNIPRGTTLMKNKTGVIIRERP